MFGRMLAMLWISPGEAGRGRNLERTSSQDPTRCWSCSPIEHEILSAGRWFIILLLLLGGNREREKQKKGGGEYMSRLFFSASKFLNGFQTLIIFHSVTAITRRGKKNGSHERCLAFSWVVGLGAMVLADAVFAWVYKIIIAHYGECHVGWLSGMHLPLDGGQQLSAIHQFLFWEKLKLMFFLFAHSQGSWVESPPWQPRDNKNLVFFITTISFSALGWRVLSITEQSGTLPSFNDSKMWKN